MNKRRIAAATLATVAGLSLLGPTGVSAAKNDGPDNGRTNGGEQVVEVTEVALHNDRADFGTDCPDNGSWWHFVLAPNSGAHTIDAMHLMVSGSAHTITAAEMVLNHGQTDNVFVAVPDGHSINGLSSAGSSAIVIGPAGRVRFVLSHVCGQSTHDIEDEADDEIVTDEIVTEAIVTDEIDEDADDNPMSDVDPSETNDIAVDAVPSVEADVTILAAETIEPAIADAPKAVSTVELHHINLDNKRTIDTTNDTAATSPSTTQTVNKSHTTSLPKTGLGLGIGGLAIMLIGFGEAIRRGALRKVA